MEFIIFLSFWGVLAAIGCIWLGYNLFYDHHHKTSEY